MISNGVSEPSSKPSRKNASCSGAGLTGRFGLSNLNLPQPNRLMCLSIRWVPRTTQRHSWTCLKGRRKRVGGLRWTGQCGSSPCCLEKRKWPHNNCQSRTSWSTKTLSTPSSSGSPSPEQHRQRFRSLDLRESCQTFALAQQLQDACRRWLMAEERDVEEVIDKVVLEQFVARLQRKTAQWAQCHRCGDPGHFISRCPVKEVETLMRVPDTPQAAPDQAGLYQIPVSIKGGTYPALVDSGCNQTSVHQSLIQPEVLDKSRVVRVRYVHGDMVNYSLVSVAIKFRGQKHRVEVAVSPHLRHPLILGTN